MRKSSSNLEGLKWGPPPIDDWAAAAQYAAMDGVLHLYRSFWRSNRLTCSAAKRMCLNILAVLSAFVSAGVQAEPIALQDEALLYENTQPYLQAYRDLSLELSAAEVAVLTSEFEPVATRYIDFGLIDDRIWLRFSATNISDDMQTYRIDIGRQYFRELELFEISAAEPPIRLLEHRQYDDFSKRTIPSRYLLADVNLEPGETKTFLIGYRGSNTTFFKLAIGSIDGVTAKYQAEQTVDLLLNGALAAMVLYSLLMLPIIGWRLALSFALYIGAGMFYVLVADGYPMRYVWPGAAWMNEPMNLAGMLMMVAMGLNFCRQLFHIGSFAPRFDRLLIAVFAASVICAVLSVPLIEVNWFMVSAYFLPLISVPLVFVAGIFAWRQGLLGSAPYLLGSFLVLISFIYAGAAHFLPGQFDLDTTLDFGHFALFAECLAFALAILLRVLSVLKQRDKAILARLEASEDRARISEQLVASRKDYDEANRLSERSRSQLSEMSHDIRQPLLVLKNALTNGTAKGEIADGSVATAVEYLEEIASQQSRKQAAISAGSDGDTEVFALQIVFDNIERLYAERADEHGIALTVRKTDLNVSSNPISLMRVVSNLIENAVQHSDAERILLAARRRGDEARLEVCDTGKGVPPDEIEAMIQPGIKGAQSDGSGLGLHIVSSVCEELGHRFEFHSKLGSGSAAFVYLPRD